MVLKKIWRNPGPDRGYSWIVLVACFFSNLILLGFIRCQGNIFLAIFRTLNISREEASYPVTAYMVTLHVAGLFSGAANHYFTSRQIILVSTTFASIGLCLAYILPQNITWICLTYGMIAGFSVGFVFPSELQALTSYFENHRSKAQNALAAGFTCGGLVYPFLVEFILEKFALRGMWLIACGILLQSYIFALLVRPRTPKQFPVLQQRNQRDSETTPAELKVILNGDGIREIDQELPQEVCEINQTVEQGAFYSTDKANANSTNGDVEKLEPETEILLNYPKPIVIVPKGNNLLRRANGEPPVRNNESFGSLIRQLLVTPTFYVVTVSYAIDVACFFAILVVFVDYGRDRGLTVFEATMLIPTLSMGELIARLFSGWITDSMIISPHKQGYIGCLASCLVYLALTISKGYYLYLIALLVGVSFCISSGARLYMTTNMFGVKSGATVCGVGNFAIGCTVLGIPKLIGVFRDNDGSYFYIFILISGFYFMLGVILFTDEIVSKKHRLKLARKQTQQLHVPTFT